MKPVVALRFTLRLLRFTLYAFNPFEMFVLGIGTLRTKLDLKVHRIGNSGVFP